jgi:hypothetical protein
MIINPSSKLIQQDIEKKNASDIIEEKDEIEFENFDIDVKDLQIRKSRCNRFIPKLDSMLAYEFIIFFIC